MVRFEKILRSAELFQKLAGYLSRKEIVNKYSNDEYYSELIKILDEELKPLGNKAQKYFGFVWNDIYKFVDVNDLYADWATKNRTDAIIPWLKIFESVSANLHKKDINQYSDFTELKNTVEIYVLEKQADDIEKYNQNKQKKLLSGISSDEIKKSLDSGNSIKIYEDENYAVYRINNVQGANQLGRDTSWCITRLEAPFFNEYTSNNLIFYFAFDKTRQLDDPYQKMAIRVFKDAEEIKDIKATKKTNDSDEIDPNEVPGWDIFSKYVENDAKQQPEGLLSKIMNGRGTIEEVDKLWKNNFTASLESKEYLLSKIPENLYTEEIKTFINKDNLDFKKMDEFILNNDISKIDSATLEFALMQTNNEAIYQKLWKTNYPNIQAEIALRTTNPAIQAAASVSPFDSVQSNLVDNKNLDPTGPIIKQLYKTEFDSVYRELTFKYRENVLIDNNLNKFENLSYEEQKKIVENERGLAFLEYFIVNNKPNIDEIIEIVNKNKRALQTINIFDYSVQDKIKFSYFIMKNDPNDSYVLDDALGISMVDFINVLPEDLQIDLLTRGQRPYLMQYITNQTENIKKQYIYNLANIGGLRGSDNDKFYSYIKEPKDNILKYMIDIGFIGKNIFDDIQSRPEIFKYFTEKQYKGTPFG